VNFWIIHQNGYQNAPLVKRNQFAEIAQYTVINLKCGKKLKR
jgi:hypothetical protein